MLTYVLGKPDESGLAARKGTATHKALELMARRKLAEQQADGFVRDDELNLEWERGELTPEVAFSCAYAHYAGPDWTRRDEEDCRTWFWTVMDGPYCPLKLDVVAPELYFDIPIERPWARYDYAMPDGTRLRGNLRIKGTMDLLVRESEGVLGYVDWKTGRRFDWGKNKEKSYEDLKNDNQFLLYRYALGKLFPDEEIIFTPYYIRDGGPFTIVFDGGAEARAERMLRGFFDEVRGTALPDLTTQSWRCRICNFSKDRGDGRSHCSFYRDELVELGMDRFVAKHADLSKLDSYGSGGGSSRRE